MEDLKNNNNNKKATTKPTSGVWVSSLASSLEPPGRRASTGHAIKGKKAPSPACHLVAFPEPVAAALFRRGLNVPPAPRGQRSWSALTCPPGRR